MIFDVPAGSTDAHNTSTLLDSGFWADIRSVNAGQTFSSVGSASNNLGIVGQTYTVANGGLTLNTGTISGAVGSYINGDFTDKDSNGHHVFKPTFLPPSGSPDEYNFGSGGTWQLTNVGPIYDVDNVPILLKATA